LGVVPPGEENAQIVLLDTPGLDGGRGALKKFMRNEAVTAAADCDVILHMVDASRKGLTVDDGGASPLTGALKSARAPIVLALNKVDTVKDKELLFPLLESFGALERYAAIVPISAKTGNGVKRLVQAIAAHLPAGDPIFPDDVVTDRAERFIAQELIREQLFRRLGQEVPYGVCVLVESWNEREDKQDLVIDAVIHVDRDSHKPIVIGKKGSRLKEVGQAARESISRLLDCPVHLKLFVKVSPGWSESMRGLQDMGYE